MEPHVEPGEEAEGPRQRGRQRLRQPEESAEAPMTTHRLRQRDEPVSTTHLTACMVAV